VEDEKLQPEEHIPAWVNDPHPTSDDRKGLRGVRRLLGGLRSLLPGDRAKTWVYLNAIRAPRKILRRAVSEFSRFDHVYDVIGEFSNKFKGPFSILEFGTAQGYGFAKLLGATRYLRMEDRITVHGFDSFEGLPPATDRADRGVVSNDWMKGAYRASYDTLRGYCESKGYRNFQLHKGWFEHSLTPQILRRLEREPPILVWIDCDLYSSSLTVLERLLPVLRSGCVIYFDDIDFNFFSRFTGQARLVHELNRGRFGDNLELVVDPELSWESGRVFRLVRFEENTPLYEPLYRRTTLPVARTIVDGSPFP